MSLKVKSEEYHDGVGLTWDDTGLPLSKREGQAWWAGWDEGRKDGEIDTREELADEIEWLRKENQELKLQYLSDQGQWIEETGRLREALYVISTHPVEQSKQWEIGAREMQKLARLSLEEEWGGRFNKMAQALGYFLAIDEDSQSSWKYGREEAAKLARTALGEKE